MASSRQDEKSAQFAQDTTKKMAEETRRAARTMADVGAHTAQTGADMLRRNAETAQEAWQSGSEMASRMTERSTTQVARALGMTGEEAQKAVEQSSRNLAAIVQSGTIIAHGMQNISLEWLNFAHRCMEHNIDRVNALMRCRSPQELTAFQSDVVRDNFEDVLQSARKMAEISVQTADSAVGRMAESVDRASQAA